MHQLRGGASRDTHRQPRLKRAIESDFRKPSTPLHPPPDRIIVEGNARASERPRNELFNVIIIVWKRRRGKQVRV